MGEPLFSRGPAPGRAGRLRADAGRGRMAARIVRWAVAVAAVAFILGTAAALHVSAQSSARPQPTQNLDPLAPFPTPPEFAGVNLLAQSAEEAAAKSTGCIACHQSVQDPHFKDTVRLGCTDCHGG